MAKMNESDREKLRLTFGQAADRYDEARPSYPEQLFNDLVELATLDEDAVLLEVGCGTGKATRPLARRGFRIICLELAPTLATVAARNLVEFPNAEVVTTSFERWEPSGQTFDLVHAATSWHWIDPQIRYEKAASILKAGGAIAFFSTIHAFPEDADPFFFEIQDTYEAIGEAFPDEEWPPPPPEEVPDETEEIVASGLFDEVEVRRYVWEERYNADAYIGLLDTFSGHIAMAPNKRAILYADIRARISERPDEQVPRHWLAILHVARRQ